MLYPIRRVPKLLQKQSSGTDVEVPFNVVTPGVREELVALGVSIAPPENGNSGEAYEKWLEEQRAELY